MELFRNFKRKVTPKTSDEIGQKSRETVEFFSKIPGHLQTDILKKLDFKDFVKFKQCSKETVEIANELRHRLPFNLYKNCISVSIRLSNEAEYDSFKDEPTSFICEALNSTTSNGIQMEDFVSKFVRRAVVLDFRADEHTHSSTVINLIKTLKATSLNIADVTDVPDLIKQPQIGKLKKIAIFHTKMEESDLLQLETPTIYIGRDHGLPLSAINQFLKQWVEKKRRIEKLTVLHIPREEDHLEIFENLEFSIERTPRNRTRRIQVRHIYSLTRNDGKKLFVSLDHFDTKPRIVVAEHADLNLMSFVRSQYRWAQM